MTLNSEISRFVTESLPFWGKLSEKQQHILLNYTTQHHYRKGEAILSNAFECIGLLLIRSGTMRIYILSEEGREVTLYRLSKGEICILSASCVLKSITFDVCIEAENDCDVIQIASSAISLLSSENIYMECFIYKLAAERFSDVMWTMQDILFTSFDKRLAAFLLDETEKAHSDTLKMTHEQIAKYMGSAREVVSRMLKYFANEGYVSLFRGGIRIIDKEKLRALIMPADS